jgi:hypothetical protein
MPAVIALLVLLGAGVIAGVPDPASSSGPRCSPRYTYPTEFTQDRAILAVATGEFRTSRWSESPLYTPPEVEDPLLPTPEMPEGGIVRIREPIPDSAVASAQRFAVVQAGERARSWTGDPDEVWVQPIELDPGCRFWPRSRADWIPPGDTVVLILEAGDVGLSDRGSYVRQNAWHDPYPATWRFRRDHRRGLVEERRLTAGEYYDFLGQIPPEDGDPKSPRDSARTRVMSALQAESDTLRYPVPQMLGYADALDRWVREYGALPRDTSNP